jgi:hypothetical protein
MKKLKIGQTIKVWDNKFHEYSYGHIVFIINSTLEDSDVYCSMYPGALSNYVYCDVVDLQGGSIIDEKGLLNTTIPLNVFKRQQIELINETFDFEITTYEETHEEVINMLGRLIETEREKQNRYEDNLMSSIKDITFKSERYSTITINADWCLYHKIMEYSQKHKNKIGSIEHFKN